MRFICLALGAVGALALSGCGEAAQPGEGSAAEVVAVPEDGESNFVSGVLADGEVTAAEWSEAKERTLACLAEAGIEVSFEPWDNSGRESETEDGYGERTAAQLSADAACHAKWMGGIQALRDEKLVNPYGEDMEALTVECLIRTGLAAEDFTVADLRELMERQTVEWGPDGSYEEALEEAKSRPGTMIDENGDFVALLPSGTSMGDPVAVECQLNPKAHGVGKSESDKP
jgi:hypothetical protein